MTLEHSAKAEFRKYLGTRFNLSELKTLAFDLGIDYEEIPHATKTEFARELILYVERVGRLDNLLTAVADQRPDASAADWLAALSDQSVKAKVQIKLTNAKILGKKDLKEKLAELLGITSEEVMVLAAMPGSLNVLVSLPEEAAVRLVTLDLPQQAGPYEIVETTSFSSLAPPVQSAWRLAAKSAIPGKLLSGAGGIGLGLKIFLWLIGGVLGTVLIGGGGTFVWYQSLPDIKIVNRCDRPLPLPEDIPRAARDFLNLPERLRPNEVLPLPLLSGSGAYEVDFFEDRETRFVVLRTPRPVPFINRREFPLGPYDPDLIIGLNGRRIIPPEVIEAPSWSTQTITLCSIE